MNEPFGDSEQLAHPAAGVPDGWVSVPREPTAEIIAGAAMAAWPCASPADIEMARKAADIVLSTAFDLGPGMTKDLLAATIATMAPAYRAMLATAPAAPMHQASPVERQGARDALIDVTDPWRGLYLAENLRAHSEYGDVYHPDTPSWPDDREDALDNLVHAQGFDFQIVAGDFTEEAIEDGDELYWQEMRAWNPEAPEGEWRLAWKGDTEDGPYAWFVRPMALRPEPEAIAAPPAQADRLAIKMLVAAGFVLEEKANESLRIAHGFGGELGQTAPAAAGVPAECVYAMNTGEKDEQGHELYVLTDKPIPLSDYELLYRSAPAHPSPAAALGGALTDEQIDARVNDLYRTLRDSGAHNGGMVGVAWDRAVYRMAAAPAAVPVGLQDIIGSMLNYAGVADTCEVTQGHAPVAIRNWAEMLQQLAPSAAVPVDERQDAAIVEAAKLAYGLLWMGTNLTGPDLAHRARVALRDALGKQACGEGINAARATHPQPAAAKDGPR